MKTTIRICTLAIACSAGIAYSQNAGGGERMAEFIKKIDANGDGKITKEEFLNHFKKEAEERFAKVDGNADSTLDEAEIKAVGEKMREGGMRRGGGEGRPGSESGGFRRPPGAEGAAKEKAPEGARPEGRRPEGGPRPEGGRPAGAPEGRRPEGAPEGRRPEGGPVGPGGPSGMFGSPEERFKKMDKNGDGSVDPAEMREYAASEADGNFKRMDENGDGKISLDEMKKVGERLRNAMRGGEGGMRRPPGAEGGPGPAGAGGSGGFRRPPGDEAPPVK